MIDNSTMLQPAHALTVLSSGGLSDEGFAKKKNEDAWDVFDIESGAGKLTIGIVADGVTSKAGGATASDIATDTIRTAMLEAAHSIYDPAALQATIDDAIHQANRAILEEARNHPEISNMSTTLVLAAVGWGQLQLAYLGDSRAYLLRDKQLHRLTLDHTWAQEALDKGLIDSEDLKSHPNRNVIRRFMGINRKIDIDRHILKPGHYQRNYLERDYTRSLALNPNDILLLCSDGLTERTSDVEIGSILERRADQPQRAVSELVQLALSRREQDNITAVILSLAKQRDGHSNIMRAGWIATLVGLIIALFVAYGLMRRSPIAVVENSVFNDNGVTETLSIDQQGTEVIDDNSANEHQSKLVNSHESDSSSSIEASTPRIDSVPAAETHAAGKGQKSIATRPTMTPSAIEIAQVPVQTSTPLPTQSNQLDARKTISVGTGIQATNVSRTLKDLNVQLADTADQSNSRASEDSSILGSDSNEINTIDAESALRTTAQSTPTRKIMPTPEPTQTSTSTPLPLQIVTEEQAPSSSSTNEDPEPSNTSSAESGQASGIDNNSRFISDSTSSASQDLSVESIPVASSEFAKIQFTYVLPPDQETIQASNAVAFQWITDYELDTNQVFEVVAWQPREGKGDAVAHGMGLVDIKEAPPKRLDETTWRMETEPPPAFEAGEYLWAVIVVETEPIYRRVQQIGQETRKFTLAKNGSRSGGNSSSSGCQGACDDR